MLNGSSPALSVRECDQATACPHDAPESRDAKDARMKDRWNSIRQVLYLSRSLYITCCENVSVRNIGRLASITSLAFVHVPHHTMNVLHSRIVILVSESCNVLVFHACGVPCSRN